MKDAILLAFFIFNFLFLIPPQACAADENKINKMIEGAVKEYQRGNSSNALDMIYDILEKYPKNERARDLYTQIKDDEALRLFKAAAIYFKNGENDIAMNTTTSGRELSIDVFLKFIQSKILEAKAALASQEVIKCSELISETLFFDPGNSDALRIQTLLKSGFFQEIYKNILKEKIKLSAERLSEARKLKENPVKSLSLADEAVNLDPSNGEAVSYRKYLLKEITSVRESGLERSEKERAAGRAKALKYFIKAEEAYKKRKFEKSFELLAKCLKKDPELEKARKMYDEVGRMLCEKELDKAVALAAAGKKKNAEKAVIKARYYNPKMVIEKAKELVASGKKLIDSGKKEQGMALLARAELFNPENKASSSLSAGAELDKIWEVYRAGKYESAFEKVKEVEKRYPGDIDVLFLESLTQAQIALDKGDFAPTREFLLEAIKLKPLHQEVWEFFTRLDELLNILGYKVEKEVR